MRTKVWAGAITGVLMLSLLSGCGGNNNNNAADGGATAGANGGPQAAPRLPICGSTPTVLRRPITGSIRWRLMKRQLRE